MSRIFAQSLAHNDGLPPVNLIAKSNDFIRPLEWSLKGLGSRFYRRRESSSALTFASLNAKPRSAADNGLEPE